ncbi:MAG TPA: hypothetical protein VK588_09450 [Chitinophagaceae bacterium]|nr:hypothetical protein [Chitinophagaceae bacterium]
MNFFSRGLSRNTGSEELKDSTSAGEGGEDAKELHTPILTQVNTIELECLKIANSYSGSINAVKDNYSILINAIQEHQIIGKGN